jgi:hypothetical protein
MNRHNTIIHKIDTNTDSASPKTKRSSHLVKQAEPTQMSTNEKNSSGNIQWQPLRWGKWPEQGTQLLIEGQKGRWAFIQPWACGSWEAALIVPWNERENVDAPRHVVAISNILVRILQTPKKSKQQNVSSSSESPSHNKRVG